MTEKIYRLLIRVIARTLSKPSIDTATRMLSIYKDSSTSPEHKEVLRKAFEIAFRYRHLPAGKRILH